MTAEQLHFDLTPVLPPSQEDWQHVEVLMAIDVPGQAWRALVDGQSWTPHSTNASIAGYCKDILGTPIEGLGIDPPGWHGLMPLLKQAGADVDVAAGQPWRPDDAHYFEFERCDAQWLGDDESFATAARDLVEIAARNIANRDVRSLLIERGVWYPELPSAVARVERMLAAATVRVDLDAAAPAGVAQQEQARRGNPIDTRPDKDTP